MKDEPATADPLPSALREKLGLPGLVAALEAVHFPADLAAAERARRRLAFEELFLLQLVLELRRRARIEEGARARHRARRGARDGGDAALPFALTGAQKRAVNEIVADMRAPRPDAPAAAVGDVGSGKTAVALLAAACARRGRLPGRVHGARPRSWRDSTPRTLGALGARPGCAVAAAHRLDRRRPSAARSRARLAAGESR